VVLRNTAIWVIVVVVLTLLISLALAQLMAKDFVGRRIMRWSIIVPWARLAGDHRAAVHPDPGLQPRHPEPLADLVCT
jgi:hypothetical protein